MTVLNKAPYEQKATREAFGDEIADELGYSSGEKYWDLMNKLKEI